MKTLYDTEFSYDGSIVTGRYIVKNAKRGHLVISLPNHRVYKVVMNKSKKIADRYTLELVY